MSVCLLAPVCPQALENLGCGNVLNTYLEGLGQRGWEQGSEVKEFQYQTACKQGNWTLPHTARWLILYLSTSELCMHDLIPLLSLLAVVSHKETNILSLRCSQVQ